MPLKVSGVRLARIPPSCVPPGIRHPARSMLFPSLADLSWFCAVLRCMVMTAELKENQMSAGKVAVLISPLEATDPLLSCSPGTGLGFFSGSRIRPGPGPGALRWEATVTRRGATYKMLMIFTLRKFKEVKVKRIV